MKNQKFEIRIVVGGDDENVKMEIEVWKDGRTSDFRLLEGDNLRLAYESMKNALGVVARLYIEQLHKEGNSAMSNTSSCVRNDVRNGSMRQALYTEQ